MQVVVQALPGHPENHTAAECTTLATALQDGLSARALARPASMLAAALPHLPRARMFRTFMLRSSVFFALYSLSAILCCTFQAGVSACARVYTSTPASGKRMLAHASAGRQQRKKSIALPPLLPCPQSTPTCPRFQVVYFLALVAVVQLASSKNSLTWGRWGGGRGGGAARRRCREWWLLAALLRASQPPPQYATALGGRSASDPG